MMGLFRKHTARQPSLGPGQEAWAVGDIHGCDTLLAALLAQIMARQTIQQPAAIVFLGDYVDRGPGSRQSLEMLSGLVSNPRVNAAFIRGNHDYMMSAFLDDPAAGPAWLAMGAGPTFESYGLPSPPRDASEASWGQIHERFRAAVPEDHATFLKGLSPFVQLGDYFFTHAGVAPGRPLDRQRSEDLMWIRNRFLNDKRRMEKVVVHGHTPTSRPYSDGRRIGVDTGAYAGGALTAVRLSEGDQCFLQVQTVANRYNADGTPLIAAVWDVQPLEVT